MTHNKVGPAWAYINRTVSRFRHLLAVFVEARCIDWCILLSMMLGDLNGLSQVIEKMTMFKDMTKPNLDILMQQISALEVWADQNW